MFSLDSTTLPSLMSYEAVANWYAATAAPAPGSYGYKEGERPLRNKRSRHTRIYKADGIYYLYLYNTAVVVWCAPDLVVYNPYNSVSTRAFADRFLPVGRPTTYRGQNAFLLDDVYYAASQGGPGITLVQYATHKWRISQGHGAVGKCVKKVFHPTQLKEARKRIKPFMEYIKGVLGVCGNDGSHPWAGQEKLKLQNYTVKKWDVDECLDRAQYERLGHMVLSEIGNPWNVILGSVDAEWFRKRLINLLVDRIEVPYDLDMKEWKE